MLKHTSVGSSTPQVRNPSGLRKFSQKMVEEKYGQLIESMPFPNYQIVKETCQMALERNQFYIWKRPAHIRPHWLILTDKSPAILIDTRHTNTVWSLKFPYDTRQVQKVGPLVLEASYDSQEATLWIWDVLFWEKQEIWSTMPYSKRWELLQTMIRPLIQENHPQCDIHIRYPTWMTMKQFSSEVEEYGYSYDFQPEKAGQRRLVWLLPKKVDTFRPSNFHERKMVAEGPIESKHFIKPAELPVHTVPPSIVDKTVLKGTVVKDKLNKMPDSYKILSESGEDLGLAAIRSIEMSKNLRIHFQSAESCAVEIQWHETFQKYEVKRII